MERVAVDHLSRIEDVVDYMLDHLEHKLEISELAKIAALSKWHFQRVFKLVTGSSLRNFIRTARLTRAAHDLLVSNILIKDLAARYQFGSHEGFTRSFHQQFGMSPGEYRLLKQPLDPEARSLPLANLVFAPNLSFLRPNVRLEYRDELKIEVCKTRNFGELLGDYEGIAGVYRWYSGESEERRRGIRGDYYVPAGLMPDEARIERVLIPAGYFLSLEFLPSELSQAPCSIRLDFLGRLLYRRFLKDKIQARDSFELLSEFAQGPARRTQFCIPITIGGALYLSENFLDRPLKLVAN
ncbi:MAG: helix-turn-helix transcriptional regulator [Bdellovibrionales bacterium]|nr:helix-turn-helix transcriptional regulator [Bdellovibrionales bacterium]